MELIVEDIPPWSRQSLKQHTGKVKEVLTLLQQGNEEAKIFVGNNTRERDGKSLITGMLQEHLQKIGNVALRQKPSQATELLDTEPQKLPNKNRINHEPGGGSRGKALSTDARGRRQDNTRGENKPRNDERNFSARQHWI